MAAGNTPKKKYRLFIFAALVLAALVGYLGFRTIEHEALLVRYQNEALAQARMQQVEGFISQMLRPKASYFEAVAAPLFADKAAIPHLLDQNPEIDGIFILDENRLIYPAVTHVSANTALSSKEQQLLEAITPIIHDPYLLVAQNVSNEASMPNAGWYFSHTAGFPLLVYWVKKGEMTIGFRLSYVMLLSDVINQAAFSYDDGIVHIIENGRTIYSSASALPQSELEPIASQVLAYPLNGWQLTYEGKRTDTRLVYLWGARWLHCLWRA